MPQAIWLSWDPGVRGDYEGLYAWLDARQAKECGDSAAFLQYEYTDSPREALAKELRDRVTLSKETRIYVVWRDGDDGKLKGRFVIGGRKGAPWSGYASLESVEADEA
jgi:hypothetical protein